MRDAIFILMVALILLGLSAIRYRRQIVTAIAFWKQFQAARAHLQQAGNARPATPEKTGIKLVNCARCGKWIAENQAVRHSTATFVCANECKTKQSV